MIRTSTTFLLAMLAIAAGLLASAPQAADERGGSAAVLTINGAIGPATSDYVVRGLQQAQENDARLVVLVMDTPGGLDTAMRDIIKAILSSSVPVVTYVSPGGSRAASAGTYILYASHVAAMAPGTNLGAATPVQIGGQGGPEAPVPDDPAPGDAETGGVPEPERPTGTTAMERKSVNDAIAYIRGLAEMRNRNADWAEEAVRSAASISASEALERNVIDIVATNLGDLLRQVDGRVVELDGVETTLATEGLVIERIEADWRTRLLDTLTNPSVAYLLMLIGIYGLLFEGYNPGAIVPGVVGAIALLLALYAFQVLDVNYAGLALIVLGIVLMISEIFVPSFGALGIGGILAFIIGSIILIDTDVPGFGVNPWMIGTVAGVGGAVVMAIVWFAVRARQMPVVTGRQELVGAIAEAITDIDGRGKVFVHGENWNAVSSQPVARGQKVRITAIDGLLLQVEPYLP